MLLYLSPNQFALRDILTFQSSLTWRLTMRIIWYNFLLIVTVVWRFICSWSPCYFERQIAWSVSWGSFLSGWDTIIHSWGLSRAPAKVLGRSSHGTSYKATLDNGHVLTVKWLREGLAKHKKEFAREAKKFGNIRHPNLVSLRGYYWGPREHEKLTLSNYVSTESLANHLYGEASLFIMFCLFATSE